MLKSFAIEAVAPPNAKERLHKQIAADSCRQLTATDAIRNAGNDSCQQLSWTARETPHEVGPQGRAFKGARTALDQREERNRQNKRHGIKTPNCLNWLHHIFQLHSSDYGCDAGNTLPVFLTIRVTLEPAIAG
jgi:hypothetical protein